ncbi:SHOCT domain-containing protein (plasmid) [Acinetobacter lwoffii]|uniref:SHOCT domain-containing protein n=1 Tax=Acinetobacter lwoffii TaxID=28090 RepID=UPI0012A053F6|nr:SHOCT domain-containing protein [Acinetobacter lwoffii]
MAEIIIIVVIIAIIVAVFKGIREGRERIELKDKISNDFKASYGIDQNDYYVSQHGQLIAIDKENEKVIVWENCWLYSSEKKEYIIKFNDIYAIETYIDGINISRTVRTNQVVSAAIGGLLFGGVGAVVGALTSEKKEGKVKNIVLRIIKNDVSHPAHEIIFLKEDIGFDRDSTVVKPAEELMEKWKRKLNIIIKNCDQKLLSEKNDLKENSQLFSQLKQLHELKVEGILTEEEYNVQKAKILE